MVKNLRAGLIVAGTLVLIGLILADGPITWPHQTVVAAARLLGALVLTVALAWFIIRSSDVPNPNGSALGRPVAEEPSASEIASAYAETIDNYEKATVSLFVQMLVDPPSYLERINERATVEAEAPRLRITSSQVFRLSAKHWADAERPRVLLVPLVRPEKGTLLDEFLVTDAGGGKIPTLSNNQIRGLLAYTLEAIITRFAPRDYGPFAQSEPEARASMSRAMRKLSLALCSPGPLEKLEEGAAKERLKAALASIEDLPTTSEWQDRIKNFCEQFIDGYVIVAEVEPPVGNRLLVTYTHCVPLESPTNHPYNQWRERFGLSPSTVDVVVNPYAFQVETYHLQISAQSEQYVFDHHLEWLAENSPATQGDIRANGIKPYIRVYHEEARPNAHLYIRRQGQSPYGLERNAVGKLKAVVQFREIPPGALGGAVAVACASAAIVTFFALTRVGLDGRSHDINSDIPAVLLALPAFVSVLIGSWMDVSRLRHTSLTTYLALAGTMFFSLASALFYLYNAGHRDIGTAFVITAMGDHKITTDVVWITLAVVTVTHALFLIRSMISESRYYFGLVRKRVLRQI